jgi:hypothetical protein
MVRKTKLAVHALESRITPTGDLNVSSVSVGFPNGTVPGARYTVSVTLTNSSMDRVKGLDDVTVEMVDANTQIDVGTIKDVQVIVNVPPCANTPAMPPGQEKLNEGGGTGSKEFDLPVLDLGNPDQYKPGMYRIKVRFGQLSTETGSHEALSQAFDYEYQFGKVPVGDKTVNAKMTVKGSNGNATFSMKGDGKGTFTVGSGVLDLAFNGTGANSAASESGGGRITLRDISADALMKSVIMPDVDEADGFIQFNGGLLQFAMNDFGDGTNKSTLTIASGAGKPANLGFSNLSHVDVTANDGIKLFLTTSWTSPANSPSPDLLTAKFVDTILDAGDFAASLHATGAESDGTALRKALIAGTVNGTWQFDGATAEVKDIYAGKAEGWYLVTPGHVDKLVIGSDFLNTTATTDVKAGTIGNFQVVGNLAGNIEATDADKQNIGINSFKAGGVIGGTNLKADLGGIQTIETGTWDAPGNIDAKWIKTLTAKPAAGSSFSPNISLMGAPRPGKGYSLDSATIGGDLTGTWTVSEAVNSIDAKSASNWSLLNGVSGSVDKLKVHGAVNNCTIDLLAIGSLSAVSYLGSTIKSMADIKSFEIAVDPNGGSSSYMTTNVTAGGQIGTVVLHDVNPTTTSCAITAREIVNYTRSTGNVKTVKSAHYTTTTPKTQLDTVGQFSVKIV